MVRNGHILPAARQWWRKANRCCSSSNLMPVTRGRPWCIVAPPRTAGQVDSSLLVPMPGCWTPWNTTLMGKKWTQTARRPGPRSGPKRNTPSWRGRARQRPWPLLCRFDGSQLPSRHLANSRCSLCAGAESIPSGWMSKRPTMGIGASMVHLPATSIWGMWWRKASRPMLGWRMNKGCLSSSCIMSLFPTPRMLIWLLNKPTSSGPAWRPNAGRPSGCFGQLSGKILVILIMLATLSGIPCSQPWGLARAWAFAAFSHIQLISMNWSPRSRGWQLYPCIQVRLSGALKHP